MAGAAPGYSWEEGSMSCPTCGHTLAVIADESLTVWQCERCGTVQTIHFAESEQKTYVPKLVERCRRLESVLRSRRAALMTGSNWREEWRCLGIAESIY